jgi:hypothetical protein
MQAKSFKKKAKRIMANKDQTEDGVLNLLNVPSPRSRKLERCALQR